MTAEEIVRNGMYAKDEFSRWLGIDFLAIESGYCKLKMTVRQEMVNGFGMAHGGISYSFADSALAFASNSFGRHAVSIETSISHTKPIFVDDTLVAEAKMVHKGKTLGIFDISVKNQKEAVVALFKGTVYFKDTNW